MPDGTVFDTNDDIYSLTSNSRIRTFVNKIVDWAEKHAEPKLRLASDEVEFMDIWFIEQQESGLQKSKNFLYYGYA